MSLRLRTKWPHAFNDLDPGGALEINEHYLLLSNSTEYRKFDAGIASAYRITSWRLVGSITSDRVLPTPYTLTCSYDITFPAALFPDYGFGDERDLASHDTDFEGPGVTPVNAGRLFLAYLAGDDTTSVSLGVTIVRDYAGGNDYGYQILLAEFRDNDPSHVANQIQRVYSSGLTAGFSEVGDLVISVPGWRGAANHEDTFSLNAEDEDISGNPVTTTASFTLTGIASYAYDGIWDPSDASNLLDPITGL